jgi:hypothetical protein
MPNCDLIWKKGRTWLPFVSRVIDPLLRKDARKKIRGYDTSDFYDDNSEWLKLLGQQLTIGVDVAVKRLAAALVQTSMRTYHGCRPKDVRTYFEQGLRIHCRQELKAQFQTLIPDNALLSTKQEEVLEDKFRNGKLYVVVDDRYLVDFAGHYMIYGSEWLMAVLPYHRDLLLESGTPTVLEISLPLARVDFKTRIELARYMLLEWARQLVRNGEIILFDFSFMFKENLPRELIVSHFHPGEIRNPLEKMAPYPVDISQCAICSTRLVSG